MTQVTTKAGLAELNAPGVGDYYEAHVDHVREVFAAIEAEVRAEIAAQVRALPWNPAQIDSDAQSIGDMEWAVSEYRDYVLRAIEADSVTPEASVGERCARCRHEASDHVSGDGSCVAPHCWCSGFAVTPAASDGSLDVERRVLNRLRNIMAKRLAPRPGTVLAVVNDEFMSALLDELRSSDVQDTTEAKDG